MAVVMYWISPAGVGAVAVAEKTTRVEDEMVKVYEPWQVPVVEFRVTQKFNWRHTGIDLAAKVGSEIRPVVSGKVVKVEKNWIGYGFHVVVEHEDGHETLYAHMSKISVGEGQMVDKQTVLGEVGSTGNSTGPHLHLEVRRGGKLVNPSDYVEFAK